MNVVAAAASQGKVSLEEVCNPTEEVKVLLKHKSGSAPVLQKKRKAGHLAYRRFFSIATCRRSYVPFQPSLPPFFYSLPDFNLSDLMFSSMQQSVHRRRREDLAGGVRISFPR
jgi:hypothetical protein